MFYLVIYTLFVSTFTLGCVIGLVIIVREILEKLKLNEEIEDLQLKKNNLISDIHYLENDLDKIEISYFSKLSEFNTLNNEIVSFKNVKKVGKKK